MTRQACSTSVRPQTIRRGNGAIPEPDTTGVTRGRPLLYVDNHVEIKNWLATIPPSQHATAYKSEPTEAYGDWSDDPDHKK